MYVKFWGVRGSIPVPGPTTAIYGGNTACVEVRNDKDELLIIDLGTGVRELGNELLKTDLPKYKKIKADILLSHTHWDHIHGFPFFVPAFIPVNEFTIYGPVNYEENLKDIIAGQMKYSYFPVKLASLQSKLNFVELKEEEFTVGSYQIKTQYLNHPILVLGYRITCDGKTLVYASDTEPYYNLFDGSKKDDDDDDIFANELNEMDDIVSEMNAKVINFVKDADCVIYDAQYTTEEYPQRVGYGHSTYEDAINVCTAGNVPKLVFYHPDPTRTDQQLDEYMIKYKKHIEENNLNLEIIAAKEKEVLQL